MESVTIICELSEGLKLVFGELDFLTHYCIATTTSVDVEVAELVSDQLKFSGTKWKFIAAVFKKNGAEVRLAGT